MTAPVTYRDKCHTAVTALGGNIADNSVGNMHCYEVKAPDGYLWSANRMHTIIVAYRYGRNAALLVEIETHWQNTLQQVGKGLERCDARKCAWCTV